MGNEPVVQDESITLSSKEEDDMLKELVAKEEELVKCRIAINDLAEENDTFRKRLYDYETESQKAKDQKALETTQLFLALDLEILSPSVRDSISKMFFSVIGKQLENMTITQIMNLSKGM